MALFASFSPGEQHPGFEHFQVRSESCFISRSRSAVTFSPSRASSNSVSRSEVRRATSASWAICLLQALAILHDLLAFFGLDSRSRERRSALRFWLAGLSCAGASKIAPHSVSLLAERNVLSFEFFEGHETLFYQARPVANAVRFLPSLAEYFWRHAFRSYLRVV